MAHRWTTRRNRPSTAGIYDPNMTPLIDVSLVLVVILMVATPLAFQSGIAVNGAASSGKRANEAARADRVELTVLEDGNVRVNRSEVAREALGATIEPLLARSATGLVVVRCEPHVSHGVFVGVLDEAKTHGASRIAVVGG